MLFDVYPGDIITNKANIRSLGVQLELLSNRRFNSFMFTTTMGPWFVVSRTDLIEESRDNIEVPIEYLYVISPTTVGWYGHRPHASELTGIQVLERPS